MLFMKTPDNFLNLFCGLRLKMIFVLFQLMCLGLMLIQIAFAIVCPVPPPCKCTTNSGLRAYCNGLNLTEIPVFVKSGGPWNLDLSNNKIQFVKSDAFTHIQLESLYLSNNSISYVDDGAFAGSECKIDVLRLDGNHLIALPAALTNLPYLIGLTIQYNQMTELDEYILTNLSKSLIGISFGSKHMTSWPTSLRKLQNLLMLSVYDLPLDTFPDSAFMGFEKTLTYLEVISTQFTNIPVSMNQLVNLNYVILKENRFLKEIPEEVFRGLQNITTIILQHNALKTIPSIFKDSNKMYQVTITSENITDITESKYPTKSQPRFNYLTITNTGLRFIPKSISNMPTVTVVSMANGNISGVHSTDLKNMPALTNIVLTNNPLSTIDSNALQNLTSLRYLSLDGTKLTTVPEAVQNTKVTWINLSRTSVICTCSGLRWMKNWPRRFNTTIEGSCVNVKMTIDEFKKSIVPTC